MSGDATIAYTGMRTAYSDGYSTQEQNNDENKAGMNNALATALYGTGAGFCIWQGRNFLNSQISPAQVRSNARHAIKMNTPYIYSQPEKLMTPNQYKMRQLSQLCDDPLFGDWAKSTMDKHVKTINDYNEGIRVHNKARTQWFKNAQHIYAKQAIEGAKLKVGINKGIGGALILAGSILATMAAKTALTEA